jgi:hypothetical protein
VPAKCGNQDPGIIASAIVNILADIILMAFVTPRIRKELCVASKDLLLTNCSVFPDIETAED